MQGFDQGLDFVFEHAGHQPFAALFVHLVQRKQRQINRQPVFRIAWLMQISGQAVHTAQSQVSWKGLCGDAGRLMAHQLFAAEQQQGRLLLDLVFVPALTTCAGTDIGRQLLVVKSVDQLFINQHVLAPGLVLQVLHLLDQFQIGRQKRQLGVPFAGHQRLANENLACRHRVDPAKVHAPAVVDHQAVQGGALQRGYLSGLFFPVRIEQLLFQQMAGDLLHPLRLDVGNATAEQARGFDQLGGHNPATWFFAELGPRVPVKLDAARTEVPVVLLTLEAEVAKQPAQHRQMQLFITGWLVVQDPFLFAHHAVQLRMDVAPLAHPPDVDVVLAQQVLVLAVGQLVVVAMTAAHISQPLPEFEVTGELAFLVVKLGMLLVGLRLFVHGPVAHVLHAEGAGDHQHFVQRLPVSGLQNHAAHTRVQRQFGQAAAHGREFVVVVHRAEFGQQLVAVGNRPALRRLDESEAFYGAQVQRFHAQDHCRQRAAQNFRVGKTLAPQKILFVVQAYTNAVRDTPAAPGALIRGGLRDRLDHQLLDLVPEAVALDPRRARINHVTNARHRQ